MFQNISIFFLIQMDSLPIYLVIRTHRKITANSLGRNRHRITIFLRAVHQILKISGRTTPLTTIRRRCNLLGQTFMIYIFQLKQKSK